MNSRLKSQGCECLEEGIATPISHFEKCSLNHDAIYDQMSQNIEEKDYKDPTFSYNLSNIWGTGSLTAPAGSGVNLSLFHTEYIPKTEQLFEYKQPPKVTSLPASILVKTKRFAFLGAMKPNRSGFIKVTAVSALLLLIAVSGLRLLPSSPSEPIKAPTHSSTATDKPALAVTSLASASKDSLCVNCEQKSSARVPDSISGPSANGLASPNQIETSPLSSTTTDPSGQLPSGNPAVSDPVIAVPPITTDPITALPIPEDPALEVIEDPLLNILDPITTMLTLNL